MKARLPVRSILVGVAGLVAWISDDWQGKPHGAITWMLVIGCIGGIIITATVATVLRLRNSNSN